MKSNNHTIMKRLMTIALALVGALMLVLSCEKAPFVTMTGPRSFTFTRDGGTQSFTFTCNRDWSVSSSDSWIHVSPASGTKSDNEVTVTITCSANTTYDPRNATITVRVEELTETISVSQETGLGLLVLPTTFDLTNAAQEIEIEVQKNVQYAITIDDACKDWISQKGTKALSSEKVTFTIAANETYDNREGKITFKQTDGDLVQTVTVKQSQTDGLIIPTSEYNLSKESQTLNVDVNSNVQYEVTTEVEWIHYIETKALSTSTIVLSIDANDTYYPRSGQVKVLGKEKTVQGVITINQDQTDALFITDESKEYRIASTGGTISVNVFHNITFEVNPALLPDWLSVSSTAVDTYNSKLTFNVKTNNEYVGRSVSLSIKGKDLSDSFTIEQHQVDIVFVDNDKYDFQWNGSSQLVKVFSDVDYTIKTPDWITTEKIASIEENNLKVETYSIIPEENLDYERDGVISLMWNNEGTEKTTEIQIHQNSCVLTLSSPGALLDELGTDRVEKIRVIKIIGDINGTDFLVIRRMEKIDCLDISASHVVAGGRPYYGEYITQDNVITSHALSGMNFSKLYLPKDIIEIADYAIRDNPNLESIEVPNTVTSIGDSGLGYNYRLKEVKLSSGLKTLGDSALESDYLVEELTIPEGVTTIGYHAFSWMSSLKKVILPSTLIKVEGRLFDLDDQIQEVHLKASPSSFTGIGTNLFVESVYENAILYVPKGTKDEYYFSDFGRFKHIQEE